MRTRITLSIFSFVSGLLLTSCSTRKQLKYTPKPDIIRLIDQNLTDAAEQYKFLMKRVPKVSLPISFEKGVSKSTTSRNWISGFYPGTLFYLYQATKDTALYNEGLRKLRVLEPEKYINSHDIG